LSLQVNMPTCVHVAGWDCALVEIIVDPEKAQRSSAICTNVRTYLIMANPC
jgi:hypothetical protein